MTYRPGMDRRTAAFLRMEPGHPRVICDGDGCGAVKEGITSRGLPPAWLLDRRAPPGWKLTRTEHPDGRIERVDVCPRCKPQRGNLRNPRRPRSTTPA